MKLQQATRCAILSLLHVASRPGQQISAGEIADIYKISQNHLAKVLRVLSMAGLVESTRGARGGFCFVADARKVTLYDVIRLFEPELMSVSSNQIEGQTDIATELFRVIAEIDRLSAATLHSVTLQTIINNCERASRTRARALDTAAKTASQTDTSDVA